MVTSQPISTRQPSVYVSYNTSAGRSCKFFSDAHKAKQFYIRQFGLGNKPSLSKERIMAKATTTKKSVKKVSPKKAKAVKKVSKKVTAEKGKPSKKRPPKKRVAKASSNGSVNPLEGRTRIKSLAILTTLKTAKNGMGGKDLRVKAKFPCMAALLTKLSEAGYVRQEETPDIRGITYTVFKNGKLTAKAAEVITKATAAEKKEAAQGNVKRKELATWAGLTS